VSRAAFLDEEDLLVSFAGESGWFDRRFSLSSIFLVVDDDVVSMLALSRAAAYAGPWTNALALTTMAEGDTGFNDE